MDDFYLLGTLPLLDGAVVQALIAQVITNRDPDSPPPFIVYLGLGTGWWRLFSDGPHLYAKFVFEPPEAWEAPQEGFAVHLRDLGHILNLQGRALRGWSYGVHGDAPSLTLNFQDGQQITFSGEGEGFTSYTLATWHLNPPAS
ncbi:MAG: hypothetical protein ACR2J4_10345 [Deinococcus sp.]